MAGISLGVCPGVVRLGHTIDPVLILLETTIEAMLGYTPIANWVPLSHLSQHLSSIAPGLFM